MNIGRLGFLGRLGGVFRSAVSAPIQRLYDMFNGTSGTYITAHTPDVGGPWVGIKSPTNGVLDGAGKAFFYGACVLTCNVGVFPTKIVFRPSAYQMGMDFWVNAPGDKFVIYLDATGKLSLYEGIASVYYLRSTVAISGISYGDVTCEISGKIIDASYRAGMFNIPQYDASSAATSTTVGINVAGGRLEDVEVLG